MQDSADLLIHKAQKIERKYNWIIAAGWYQKAIGLATRKGDLVKAAEVSERMGYSFFRAALQAEKTELFKSRMTQAIEAYKKAARLFQKNPNGKTAARVVNCQAKAFHARSWIETHPARKRGLLYEWWSLSSKALEMFDKNGDQLAIAKTCNDMMEGSMDCKYWIEPNWKEAAKIRKELFSLGERALAALSKVNDNYELARAHCWISSFCLMNNVSVFEEERELVEKGLAHSKKAMEFSKKTGDIWLVGWSHMPACYSGIISHDSSLKRIIQQWVENGEFTRDNYLLGVAKSHLLSWTYMSRWLSEDPAKNRERFKCNLKFAPEAIRHLRIINMVVWNPYYSSCVAFQGAASIELEIKTKKALMKKAAEYGRKAVAVLEGWHQSNVPMVSNSLSQALFRLSEIENNPVEKKHLITELLENTQKTTKILEAYPYSIFYKLFNQSLMILAKAELSKISTVDEKIGLLNEAVSSIAECQKAISLSVTESQIEFGFAIFGDFCYKFGGIFNKLYSFTGKRKLLSSAREIYDFVIKLFDRVGLTTRIAESFWQKAKMHDQLGEFVEAAKDYELTSETYLKAAQKIPQLKSFYEDHSQYMQAWSQLEQARYNHSIEDYVKARQQYEKAAELHESTESWSYLAPNYLAWAEMEEAEGLSRREQTQKAKDVFQKALERFVKAEKAIKQKIGEIISEEERDLNQRLLQASDLRRRFCQARIRIEEAKLLDREGRYLQSSKSYKEATQNILSIIEKVESEAERKELHYLGILCQAWEKMALAEETTSSESYLDAATLFEQAKEQCYTKKASLWALGNSNYCRGLAAGIKYQTTLSLSDNALAKRHIENAATNYLQAGFNNASEYAKATLRLFDAYVFINQAQNEIGPEKKAKQYQMAEKLLQMSADSFLKDKQTEKIGQVNQILEAVREEKRVALSLNEVMLAPSIASSTLSFAAPTSTSEASVGLEKFEHANVQANLIAGMKEVKVGESFCLSVEFVNAGKEPALLTRVEDFVPPDFIVVKKPEIYRLEDTCLNMKGKQIAPLKLVEAKLVLQPSRKGVYHLSPVVHYLDELGQNKSLQLKPVEIKVEEVILAERVSTGTKELDSLLLGGIPKEYSIVLTGAPSDERELLIRNFLEAGVEDEQTGFYVTTEAVGIENLLEKPGFYLFLCNPKPKVEVPDLPNVYKLRGKNLTNLNIDLLKAYRNVAKSSGKRVVVEIVSDVLVDYGLKITRQWITELTADLVSKGFTVLAVMNPGMHPTDQATGVVDLFDGEISLFQTEDPLGCRKSLRIKKLRNQDYIKNSICLS